MNTFVKCMTVAALMGVSAFTAPSVATAQEGETTGTAADGKGGEKREGRRGSWQGGPIKTAQELTGLTQEQKDKLAELQKGYSEKMKDLRKDIEKGGDPREAVKS